MAFQLQERQRAAIQGPNGCSKSNKKSKETRKKLGCDEKDNLKVVGGVINKLSF